jgi:hypothetical protein
MHELMDSFCAGQVKYISCLPWVRPTVFHHFKWLVYNDNLLFDLIMHICLFLYFEMFIYFVFNGASQLSIGKLSNHWNRIVFHIMNFNMPLGVLHDLIFLVLTLGFGTHYQYTTCLEKVISALDFFPICPGCFVSLLIIIYVLLY